MTPTPAAHTQPETEPRSRIQPLGEQIIIRTIPVDSVGSILIPDSAKGITMMGEKGAEDAKHFVEAEVIAVGPGKRQKGDARLLDEAIKAMQDARHLLMDAASGNDETRLECSRTVSRLVLRYEGSNDRLPPLVQPGDRILYHPAVQRFDRDITDVMSNGEELNGSKYFMIREESVLAVIEQ